MDGPAATAVCWAGERNRGMSRELREGSAAKTQGGESGGEKGARRAAKERNEEVARDWIGERSTRDQSHSLRADRTPQDYELRGRKGDGDAELPCENFKLWGKS